MTVKAVRGCYRFLLRNWNKQDLSNAAIEGRPKLTAAAGKARTSSAIEAMVEEQLTLRDRDARTDDDYQTTKIRFNFKMPRFAPEGTMIKRNTKAWSDHTYYKYDTSTTKVR